jgi:hypothetical protein
MPNLAHPVPSYSCWLCHDTGWLCDGTGDDGRPSAKRVAILASGRRQDGGLVPPTQSDIDEARKTGFNPRPCEHPQ